MPRGPGDSGGEQAAHPAHEIGKRKLPKSLIAEGETERFSLISPGPKLASTALTLLEYYLLHYLNILECVRCMDVCLGARHSKYTEATWQPLELGLTSDHQAW